MLTKRILSVTVVVQIICWSTIALLFLGRNGRTVQAIPFYQEATPEPFLGPIYYGQEDVMNVFDHEFPLFGGDNTDEPGDSVRHYDGIIHDPPINGYGYDAHIGIDYHLVYEPVLAAANGDVVVAGWSNPANHRLLYGLHVEMIHHANTDYRVWYGHLSTLSVKTGDEILIDAADPGNRNRILGISGNTGSLLGCDDPVGVDPLCSTHLHFEVRQISGNRPVNPYGWIGLDQNPPVADPWANHEVGATSYNLWENPPVVTTNQYPSGAFVTEPPLNDYLIEVDDAVNSNLFTINGDCWTSVTDIEGIDGDYHSSLANTPGSSGPCDVQWSFDSNAFAPAGDYDIYAHIPDPATSLSAEYTIFRQGIINTAIVVQAAYPPYETHDGWAYIGRYHFDMNGSLEFIRLNNQNGATMTEDTGNLLIADAIRLMPANTPPDIEVAVVQSSDDAGPYPVEWPLPSDACSATDPQFGTTYSEVYFGHCPDGTDMVSGFRFQNVAIPQGATITAAQIEFTVDGLYTNNIEVQFQGELTGDSAAFSDTNRPSDRNPLTTAVPWYIGSEDEWFVWQTRLSPDLSAVVQEIVNQSDWVSGNALTIIAQPVGTGVLHRRVIAWDREGVARSARLQIWYTEPVPPTPTPPPGPPPPINLTAVFFDDLPHPTDDPQPNRIIPLPQPYVLLSWQPSPPPPKTTFNVYRSASYPVPVDAAHRIAAGLSTTIYEDYVGISGYWYVVTAVNSLSESAPSNHAQASPPCPDC